MRGKRWVMVLSVFIFVGAGALSKQQLNPSRDFANGSLHVGSMHLAVSNLERSKAFYRDTLGLTLTAEEPGHTAGFEGGLLWLGPGRLKWSERAAPITVVLFTRSAELAYRELKAKGVEIPSPSEDSAEGTRSFAFKDPDGYRIEIVETLALGLPLHRSGSWREPE